MARRATVKRLSPLSSSRRPAPGAGGLRQKLGASAPAHKKYAFGRTRGAAITKLR